MENVMRNVRKNHEQWERNQNHNLKAEETVKQSKQLKPTVESIKKKREPTFSSNSPLTLHVVNTI